MVSYLVFQSRPWGRFFLTNVVVVALGVLFASVAQAQTAENSPRRVVVETFHGPEADRFRESLIVSLKKRPELEMVSEEAFQDVASQSGTATLTEEDYAVIAKLLNVSAFISGSTTHKRARWSGVVQVRNGEDGTILGEEVWSGHSLLALGAIQKDGYDRLEVYLAVTAPPGSGVESAAPSQTPPAPQAEPAETRLGLPYKPEALSVAFLTGLMNRNMTAQATVYNRGRTGGNAYDILTEERSYSSDAPGHPELGLQAEFYPGLILDEPTLAYLGVTASYRQSLFLTSFGCVNRPNLQQPCTDQEQLQIDTSQSEFFFGLRGRYWLGDPVQPFHVFGDLGYGLFQFLMDLNALRQLEFPSVIPPLSYSYVQLSLGARYDIVPMYLALGAKFAYRFGLTSPDANKIWGDQTGPSSGILIGIDARTETPYIYKDSYIGLNIDWFRFTTEFRGQAECGVPAGCTQGGAAYENTEPWELFPVNESSELIGGFRDSVADTYLRIALAFGWMLR